MNKQIYRLSAKFYDELNAEEIQFLSESLANYFSKKRFSEDSKILDLGCGTGNLLGKLSNHGYCGTGIDVAPEMVKEAKRKYPSLNFKVVDLCNFELEEKFDVILCTNDVINYLEPNVREDFFTSISKHLSLDGICYIDFDTETDMSCCWKGQKSVKKGQGWEVTRSSFYDKEDCIGTEIQHWVISNNGKTYKFNEVHKLYPFSSLEICKLVKNVSMQIRHFVEPTEFCIVNQSLDSYLRLGCILKKVSR